MNQTGINNISLGDGKAYRITGWEKHYENNRSRELTRPQWLPLPNKFDGCGFMELMDHPAGMSHYGAWCLLLAAASRMPTRGTLISDSGKPLSIKDISRMTRGSAKAFDDALPRLLAMGWIEVIDVKTAEISDKHAITAASGEDAEGQMITDKSQPSAGIPQQGATLVRLNKKGNRNEKGEGEARPPTPTGKDMLVKELRRRGLSTAPEAVQEWADFLQGSCKIKSVEETKPALDHLFLQAEKAGITISYAKHTAQFAKHTAQKLQTDRNLDKEIA
jgi:hypothetical protein